ncbi:hypothetical protein Cgig2_021207 [Carnegiea gigantea]|uniref:Protein DA1-like domain-containing protein n=1 Tax=Carnegiea gigantea TaxID=171969 RepID=A0A9Q1QSJ0_9CARY|nr:hypothetical protein Cgig2_021207 [Carnegiea gigantea]
MEGEKQGHHHMPRQEDFASEEQTSPTCFEDQGRELEIEPGHANTSLVSYCNPCSVWPPQLLTGSILAHEMMHAWLRLRGFRMLNPQIEEGICQVMAYMWLESELNSGLGSSNSPISTSHAARSSRSNKRSPFEMKLGKFFRNQIESDISPVYGDGFRAAHQAVMKYGLQRTLDHIQMTGSLPF